MPPMNRTDLRTRLAGIQTFPQLVAFLRDDMGWPIERESFEDLVFDYTPEELGIDAKNAAKIQEIKRLRPLSSNQPWGIFFVKFEPKRLPVVALRRILSSVAIRKRASANPADRTAWRTDDLLFLSSYGEGEDRRISFAHFSQDQAKDDLPTLKVLGWDNLDTDLHLADVAGTLTGKLAWPRNPSDVVAWRREWREAFTLRHREVITTSRDLAVRLAELARAIRDRIRTALSIESERGPLTKLMKAFREALVHDLDAAGFADMYAQTIAYGLLSARIANPAGSTADGLPQAIPVTNPFLKELMETFLHVGGRRGRTGDPGIDFDELGVSEVVELLDDANMEAVVRDFGDKNPQEDPVIHFYELFLKEYDAKKRMQRGVFYTPRPVVSFIVRSVDELLRTEFGLEDGLADTTTWGEMAKHHPDLKIPEGISPDQDFVQILDPATGTGTFLVEVIDLIHKTLVTKWQAQGCDVEMISSLWNEYVPRHLLTRLHGYELLMAPYAIAHLKIGLKLFATGYRFLSKERARVFLTNALEPAHDFSGTFAFAIPALAHEAESVNSIKQLRRISVVIGNPPYAGHSSNKGRFASELVRPYYSVDGQALNERNPKWLQDDYVKFMRLSQVLCDSVPFAIIGCITNHGYIDNPTFRGLRQSLMGTYQKLWILDLHGNVKKKETTASGVVDENVFDIQQGVAILLAVRAPDVPVYLGHADLRGTRGHKSRTLAQHTVGTGDWRELKASKPFYVFLPQDERTHNEYLRYPSLREVMPVNVLGFQTHRDHFAVAFDREEIVARCEALLDSSRKDSELREVFRLKDNRDWNLRDARKAIRLDSNWKTHILRCLYRPFDIRWCFFSSIAMDYPRRELLDHVKGRSNICLLLSRQQATPGFRHCWVAAVPANDCVVSTKSSEANQVFPLWLFPSEDECRLQVRRKPNLSPAILKQWNEVLRKDGGGKPEDVLDPQQILWYAYAILFSPGYRTRYEAFLSIDYPRVPVARSVRLIGKLAHLGGELCALHMLESTILEHSTTEYIGRPRPEVEKVAWTKNAVWIDKAQTSGFIGVREEVWNFYIGGFQVCEKWLKDRKGRLLSEDDIAHYQKVVVAISETIRIMKEIDDVIEEHGGWPGAFQTGEAKEQVAVARTLTFRPRTIEPSTQDRYVTCVPRVSLKVAAGSFGEAQPALDEEAEWADVPARHRLRPGMFVAEVVGKSMEPEIPDGAFCLFRAPVEGSRQGKTVLVELRDALDPETGERYTVKRYESEKREEEGSWRHASVTLRPANPDFEPIVLEAADEERMRVVAELVAVLGPDDISQRPDAVGATAVDRPAPPERQGTRRRRSRESRQGSLLETAETVPDSEAESPTEEPDRDELVCSIRQLLGDGRSRELESLIRELARELGHSRVDPGIREALERAVRAAARRGVIRRERDEVALLARAITDYEKAFLKEQFLVSLGGKAWRTRDEAIRGFARWMGFRRTGKLIQETGRSLITSLLRAGVLEAGSEGRIRKV